MKVCIYIDKWLPLVNSCLIDLISPWLGVRAGNAEEKVTEENEDVTLKCGTDNPGTVYWLRLKEKHEGFEYIATYSVSKKGKTANGDKFTVDVKSLIVKNFKQEEDSGSYSCVFINNNELRFSGTTKLLGKTGGLVNICIQRLL